MGHDGHGTDHSGHGMSQGVHKMDHSGHDISEGSYEMGHDQYDADHSGHKMSHGAHEMDHSGHDMSGSSHQIEHEAHGKDHSEPSMPQGMDPLGGKVGGIGADTPPAASGVQEEHSSHQHRDSHERAPKQNQVKRKASTVDGAASGH